MIGSVSIMSKQIVIPEKEQNLMRKLEEKGFEVYAIGGFIRDSLLGHEAHDIDLFTNATGDEILEVFKDHQTKILGNTERQEKILTVIVDGVEISQYRSNGDRSETGTSFEDHIKTCDLTINAIACDSEGNIVDLVEGFNDLIEGQLRFVGKAEERIKEDKLRVLRALRFEIKYNLNVHTLDNYYIYLPLLKELPVERVQTELMKILTLPKVYLYHEVLFDILDMFGLDIGMTYNLDGGPHHSETVDEHLEASFEVACKHTSNPLLRLAALLHDIGKPSTVSWDEKGIHFYQHHKTGSKMVRNWMKRMKFSEKEIKYVSELIYWHMHNYDGQQVTPKGYKKLFTALEDSGIPIEDFVLLRYSDNQGNLKKPRILYHDFLKNDSYIKKWNEMLYKQEPMRMKDMNLKGTDIIEEFGLKQGKAVGDILKVLFEALLNNKVDNNRVCLLEYVTDNIPLEHYLEE